MDNQALLELIRWLIANGLTKSTCSAIQELLYGVWYDEKERKSLPKEILKVLEVKKRAMPCDIESMEFSVLVTKMQRE